ncbi:General stress protein 16O [Anaerolineae bacterium]|nr:General stress protein 16O [Anaerolineae bacterium]
MPKTANKNKKAVNAPKKKEKAVAAPKAARKTAASTPKETKQMAKTTTAAKTAAVKKTAAAPAKGKVSFKTEITQKLQDAKNKILQEVSQKVRSESNILKHEIGDIYDIASNERERELTLMLGDRDREKLSEIEDALERLKDNSYGTCEECGEPIAEQRLKALPSTRVCVECMSKMEKELKIKGRGYEEETGLGILERTESEEEEF